MKGGEVRREVFNFCHRDDRDDSSRVPSSLRNEFSVFQRGKSLLIPHVKYSWLIDCVLIIILNRLSLFYWIVLLTSYVVAFDTSTTILRHLENENEKKALTVKQLFIFKSNFFAASCFKL